MKKSIVVVLVFVCGLFCFAEPVLTLAHSMDWRDPAYFAESGEALVANSSGLFLSKNSFPVNAVKKYRCSLKLRRKPGSAPSAFYLILVPATDEGREIRMEMVTAVKGSEGVLVQDAAKGANQLVVKAKDVKTWNSYYGWCVALNVKPDYSDIPNTSLTAGIKAVAVQADGNVLVTLKRPLTEDVKANTSVRIHAGGSYLYVIQVAKTPEEWTEYSGEVAGVMTEPDWRNNKFPIKTAWARLGIMANWGAKNTAIEIRDVKIEEL